MFFILLEEGKEDDELLKNGVDALGGLDDGERDDAEPREILILRWIQT